MSDDSLNEPAGDLPDPTRRALAALPLALAGWGAWPSALAQTTPGPTRLALLIGNRVYPSPHDLPPVHKNIRDLTAALEKRGFAVTPAVDLDPQGLREAIRKFAATARQAPPDATVLFYFTGHGMQVDAENLMLGAGIAPNAREDALLSGSLHLARDVVDQLPKRATGLSIAVIDACRVDLRAAVRAQDGFNQVEAPPGCLIVFSTAAGKPAIASAKETENTFYTASLVKLLQTGSDELSFSDLFRLVKLDVQQTMLAHPIPVIRQFAQVPFIAENTQVRFRLSPRPDFEAPPAPQVDAAAESNAWKDLEASTWPADVLKLAEEYLQRYPASARIGSVQVSREGAGEAVRALRGNDVRLYRSAFQPKTTQAGWLAEWRKAARGDKDAAARIARAYLRGDGDIAVDTNRYEGWLQYAAALGNGIACYELAVWYRRQGQPAPAAQYEARSRELGYTPPTTLDHYRK